jgi:N-acetylmuramic acid 6-phosphate etherase
MGAPDPQASPSEQHDPADAPDLDAIGALDLDALRTEQRDPALAELDLLPTAEVVRAIVRGHDAVVAAVAAAEAEIVRLAEATADRMNLGGRVVYAGAGTAGRVAMLDAVEWGPTFDLAGGDVVALLAGAQLPPGSPEEAAAEDDEEAGRADLAALDPRADDVVVAVSASGRTPYALGAVRAGAAAGALTAAVTAQPRSVLAAEVDVAIEVPVGPEVLSGSTRLKAGTAQKLVLNAFSTAVMVRRGRTLGDLMAGMRVGNDKLRVRAARVCQLAAGCRPEEARAALAAAGDDLDVAILIAARGLDPGEARRRLAAANRAVRAALDGR